jgi:hypothetical protein
VGHRGGKLAAFVVVHTENLIRDHPAAPKSPLQNGHAERLIGSIRWECLDHIVVFGETHLRQILAAYTGY